MKRHALSVLAYVLATFTAQALSHFAVNAEHYAAVTYLRAQPIFALGIASMVIQGGIFSWLYSRLAPPRASLASAVGFAWLMGGVLLSYIALAELAKYAVPAVLPWMAVELSAGFLQFTVFGLLLGLVYRGQRLMTRPGQAMRPTHKAGS